ncbi:MAG: thermosome subunit beta [Thermoplasmata archaeon]
MMTGQVPILVLKEGTERESGKDAKKNNIAAARAIADAVKTTLGPKGMDKMLVDGLGDIVITNDGATILKEIDVQHPAAKMIVEVAKSQDQEVGDGTTTAVVLAGELLKQAESLLEQNVHATIINNGYRLASQKTLELISKVGKKIDPKDELILKKIATTAMTGKNIGNSSAYFADLAVKSVTAITEKVNGKTVADIDNIKVEKKTGGGIAETAMIDGIVLDKEKVHPRMPKIVNNAKIALINEGLEIKKTEISAKIQIEDPTKIHAFLDEEEKQLKNMVELVNSSGANVLICEKGIDDLAQHYLSKHDIYAVRRVKKSDIEKLAKATGAKIVTNLTDLKAEDLGFAKTVEERKIGNDNMTFVTGCKNPKAVSILIRGGTEHVIAEVERALHDALKVVSVAIEEGVAVPGGGAIETELAMQLRKYAPTVGGREQLAIEAFANALEVIPRTLAENAGMDAINILIDIRSQHEKGNKGFGIDVFSNKAKDMFEEGVIEPAKVKEQAIESAMEVATMILRIDDVIQSKKREGQPGGMPGGGMPGGGMGGMPGMGGMGGMPEM